MYVSFSRKKVLPHALVAHYAMSMIRFLRLSGRKVCENVKKKGLLWKGRHFQVRYLFGAPRTIKSLPQDFATLYCGLLTSIALDKSAVKRNRMRRRCKEALRLVVKAKNNELHLKEISSHGIFQLLVIPRSSSLSAPFEEVQNDANALLAFLLSLPCPTQRPQKKPQH